MGGGPGLPERAGMGLALVRAFCVVRGTLSEAM